MKRPKMNRKAHRSGPVECLDSQLKNPENPSNRQFLYPCIQEAASSSRTYEKHQFPGPYTSDIYMRPGQDQDSDVVHRLCSKWRLLHGYKRAFDGFSGIFNWQPERATGSFLWDFLFILGGSIPCYTNYR